jgi:hypothetical protein
MVYAITFGFAVQEVLQKHLHLQQRLSSEVQTSRDIACIINQIEELSTGGRQKIFRLSLMFGISVKNCFGQRKFASGVYNNRVIGQNSSANSGGTEICNNPLALFSKYEFPSNASISHLEKN